MKRRKTQSKQKILEILKESDTALNHEMIKSKLESAVDRATIYRVLNSFCEDGIVHKISGDDGKQYFAICSRCTKKEHRHNHFHFRCIECGRVECLKNEVAVVVPKGYISENFNGLISGRCNNCS